MQGITSLDAADKLKHPNFRFRPVAERLDDVLKAWKGSKYTGDWGILKGATVLDIGCGSVNSIGFFTNAYEPFFCRLASVNGAQVFGIDIKSPSPEDDKLYTHVYANLLDLATNKRKKLSNLPSIRGRRFDIIRMCAVVDDPSLSSGLSIHRIDPESFLEKVKNQTKKMLAEGGVLDLEYRTYKITNGILVPTVT